MKVILDFLDSTAAMDMIIALLHTLWQGLVIAMALFFVLRGVSGKRSELRYRLAILSMLLIVVCWLGTFSILQYEPEPATSAAQNDIAYKGNPVENAVIANTTEAIQQEHMGVAQPKALTISTEAHDSGAVKESRFSYASWAIMFWLAGVCVMLSRMFWALAGAAKLRRNSVDIEDPAIVELFEQLCRKMQIKRKIRFAASRTLLHPGVIGFWRPVLLVPVSILSEISVDDLRAILAHELAHIRRFDYLVNFCQMVVEAVLFFNPAVWWVSRQIRIEREACCDAAGVAVSGQRVQYARVLFEQFAKAAAPKPAMAAAITGFSDDNNTASEERVKRVIDPQHKPHIKIGWVKLACCVGIAAIVLLGLWKTTDMTIAMAAKIMTPAERIEKMQEIAKTHSGEYKSYKETDRVTLSGTVATFDGKPLPKYPQIYIKAYGPRHSSGVHFNIQKDGTFEHFVRCHENVFVAVEIPGYAPSYSQTYHPEPNDVIDNIHIVLTDGFTAKVKVIDEQQNPIPNATLNKNYFIQKRDGWSGYGQSDKIASDKNGVALFEHCLEKPVKINVQADGYQKIDSGDYTLKPNETTVITLKKGLIASGVVLAKETGEPVSEAKFKLVYKDTPGHGWHYGTSGKDYEAVTDASGKFTLNTLAETFKYTYVVEAEGYNRTVLAKIQPGDKNLRVEMLPELRIKGKIIGDLSKLRSSYSKPSLYYRGEFEDGYTMQYEGVDSYGDIQVEIKGSEGYFTLTNILGDTVRFYGKNNSDPVAFVKLNDKSIEDLIIDLDRKTSNYVLTRPVVLTFKSPEGSPPVAGKAKVWYMTKEVEQSKHRQWSGIDVEVENGIAKFDFPVPAYIRLAETKDIPGFWFEPQPWDTSMDNFVQPGDAPYERTIVGEPGGSIYGTVLDEQGKLEKYAEMKLLLVERPEKYKDYDNNVFHRIKRKLKDGLDGHVTETGKFYSAALPLEGTYAIIARIDNAWLISDPVTLTKEEPIQEITLQLDDTKQIAGRVLLSNGTPAKKIEVLLEVSASYSKEDSYGFNNRAITDDNGSFVFENVNPQKPLKYHLRIKPGPGYQPLVIEVKPGSDKTYRVKKGYTLKGRIIDDETGWPIPDAGIGAESTADAYDYNRARTCDSPSDKDGNFVFTSLNNERYRLYLGDADIVSPSYRGREIVGGKDKTIELRVKLRSWSQLKPRKPDDVE